MNEMKTTQRCYVLGVGKPYDFIPEVKTESVTGCKLYYLGTDDLSKTQFDEESGTIGIFPQKYTMPPTFYDTVKSIAMPCLADITFSVKLESGGAKVKISDISFVANKK